ncbi:alpha/beta hydrolase fold protein [Viridothelium virens]|uniref:Alpha/beta hydrolase fold protein n=1 Tax=Viridothelium virens TaxID=1048519 RepID=A0A6A6HB49_VIRVR|nr:alpha/beta hydrolase fold protein [Viridothelium virens]
MTTYHNLTVADGVNVFYREAGSTSKPTLLLLHGFPASSFQYRNLIPLLSDSYHIIAPDMPSFGFTTTPSNYTYTFSALTSTISAFLLALNLTTFSLYIFDYGAPVGLRLALQPDFTITALITQNGNAYLDGFGHPFWDPIMAYWRSHSAADRSFIRDNVLTLDGFASQYTTGVPASHLDRLDPAAWTLDYAQSVARPGTADAQLDLLYDYQTNVELYPRFQAWLRERQPPLLVAWGKNDPAFVPPGAEAFRRDVPGAEVTFLDTGHFAVETDWVELAGLMRRFLGRVVGGKKDGEAGA